MSKKGIKSALLDASFLTKEVEEEASHDLEVKRGIFELTHHWTATEEEAKKNR